MDNKIKVIFWDSDGVLADLFNAYHEFFTQDTGIVEFFNEISNEGIKINGKPLNIAIREGLGYPINNIKYGDLLRFLPINKETGTMELMDFRVANIVKEFGGTEGEIRNAEDFDGKEREYEVGKKFGLVSKYKPHGLLHNLFLKSKFFDKRPLFNGVKENFEYFHEQGFKQVIISAGSNHEQTMRLLLGNLGGFFNKGLIDKIIFVNRYEQVKEDIMLEYMERLGLDVDNCVLIDDKISNVVGAIGAGIKAIYMDNFSTESLEGIKGKYPNLSKTAHDFNEVKELINNFSVNLEKTTKSRFEQISDDLDQILLGNQTKKGK